jgi:hypothetical protein
MDLIKKANSRKLNIEPGEEALHELYLFKQTEGTEVTVLVGVDGGSTQTRLSIVDLNNMDDFMDQLQEIHVIPSVSLSVTNDQKIPDKGNFLYDHMDSSITNLDTRPEALFRFARLVRGTKATDVESSENRLKSSTQKTVDPTFYYNMVDSIGYGLSLKYKQNIPSVVNVLLSVALPPDDTNEKNMEIFRKNLKSFKWTHTPTGVSTEIRIKAVRASTEPEAFIKAYYALSEEDSIPENILHIEGGGRSMGIEILINGQSLATAQKTLSFGGSQLLDNIGGMYVAKNGGSPLKRDVLEKAVRTGKLRAGNDLIDITGIIQPAKEMLGKKIVNDTILTVFDQQTRVSLQDLNVISVSGRLFDETPITKHNPKTGEDEVVGGISLAPFVSAGFKALVPSVRFLHIKGNYIPIGLVIQAYNDFVEAEGETVSAEVASTSTVAETSATLEANTSSPEEV